MVKQVHKIRQTAPPTALSLALSLLSLCIFPVPPRSACCSYSALCTIHLLHKGTAASHCTSGNAAAFVSVLREEQAAHLVVSGPPHGSGNQWSSLCARVIQGHRRRPQDGHHGLLSSSALAAHLRLPGATRAVLVDGVPCSPTPIRCGTLA